MLSDTEQRILGMLQELHPEDVLKAIPLVCAELAISIEDDGGSDAEKTCLRLSVEVSGAVRLWRAINLVERAR